MSSLTTNLKLVKPELQDNITPTIFADNFDKIDAALEGVSGGALSLEEIEASTNLDGKIPSAAALKEVNNSLQNVGLKVDTLFNGNLTKGNTATLSNSISNYKMLVVEWQKTADTNDGITQELIVNPTIGIKYSGDGGAYSSSYFYHSSIGFAFTDATTIHYNWHSHNKYTTDAIIMKVYGIK